MKIIDKISIAELQSMAQNMDGNIVKADVDIVRKVVIVDMPMHFEGEQELLQRGSKQVDLWGVNLFPAKFGTEYFIEFDSMINIKPHHNNRSMNIQSPEIRERIKAIVDGILYE